MPTAAITRYSPQALQVRMHRDMLRGAAFQADWSDANYASNATVISAGMLDYTDVAKVILRSVQDGSTGSYLLIPDCVVTEQHTDQMQITDHPVEKGTGAFISDHAYRMPAQVSLDYGWAPGGPSNNRAQSPTFLRDLYTQCLQLQTNRTLCTINTGKRQYTNMLVQSISLTTEEATENVLRVRMDCREILLATVTTATASLRPDTFLHPDRSMGASPQGIMQLQTAPTFNFTDGSWQSIGGGA